MRCLTAFVLVFALASCATHRGAYADEPLPGSVRIDRIVVDKSDHTMEVYDGKKHLKTYKIAIGKGSDGPKQVQGDNRTPEGEYRIDSRHHSKKFHRFLHVSYPNRVDRKAFKQGRKEGSISKSAKIGGAVGIHGEKQGKEWLPHKLVDWTQGCIALDNDEIEELYRSVKDGAVVVIVP
jgi:murein L,D-transpeptidase YafK